MCGCVGVWVVFVAVLGGRVACGRISCDTAWHCEYDAISCGDIAWPCDVRDMARH